MFVINLEKDIKIILYFQFQPFVNESFSGKLNSEKMDDDLLNLGQTTQEGLDRLLDDGQTGTFTREWEQHCASQRFVFKFFKLSYIQKIMGFYPFLFYHYDFNLSFQER